MKSSDASRDQAIPGFRSRDSRGRPTGSPEGVRGPERTELRLLLGIELILDPDQQGEVRLLHLLLDGRHLIELRQHRGLVDAVALEELAERLGFGVEPPLEVEELL